MPKRGFEDVDEFEAYLKGVDEIIFDGTEMAIERPKSYEGQKVKYSGKKSTHTDVALLISDKQLWIHYLSMLYPGSNVDIGVLKKEFTPRAGLVSEKAGTGRFGFCWH